MAELIFIEAVPISGKIDTPHMPMNIPLPDEKPYLSSIAVDDREVEEK